MFQHPPVTPLREKAAFLMPFMAVFMLCVWFVFTSSRSILVMETRAPQPAVLSRWPCVLFTQVWFKWIQLL